MCHINVRIISQPPCIHAAPPRGHHRSRGWCQYLRIQRCAEMKCRSASKATRELFWKQGICTEYSLICCVCHAQDVFRLTVQSKTAPKLFTSWLLHTRNQPLLSEHRKQKICTLFSKIARGRNFRPYGEHFSTVKKYGRKKRSMLWKLSKSFHGTIWSKFFHVGNQHASIMCWLVY